MCSNVLYAQLLKGWTDTDEISLHSCSIQTEDMHEGRYSLSELLQGR